MSQIPTQPYPVPPNQPAHVPTTTSGSVQGIDSVSPNEWARINKNELGVTNVSKEAINEYVSKIPDDPTDTPKQQASKDNGCNTPVRSSITTDPVARKSIPIHTTLFKYFPKAVAEIANCCVVGGAQHGQSIEELHWDRSKSGNALDALMRHALDAGFMDTDGVRHSAKIAFRALANLELELESVEKSLGPASEPEPYHTPRVPRLGDDYYFIDSIGDVVLCNWADGHADRCRFSAGNVYRTVTEAQRARNLRS